MSYASVADRDAIEAEMPWQARDVPATLEAMREGRCGIGPLEFRDVERLAIQIGGQVRGFEAEGRFNRQQMTLYDRFTQFTLAAAREAARVAGEAGFGQ